MSRRASKGPAKKTRPGQQTQKKPRLKQAFCKPCWELKYCPYGPLVEDFPLHPEGKELSEVEARYRELLGRFARGDFRTEGEILEAIEALEYCFPPRWEWILQFETSELACNVFGHICPVFFAAESFSETKVGRRRGRYIPREIMLQVVRRDGQICQICHEPVPDDQVEFDHRIPLSKGGPVSADNIRLVCRPCNRTKGDSLIELLWRHPHLDA
jgi:hypothetical protein